MAITTTSLLPAAVQQSFSYKLLAVPVPNMIHKLVAVKKRMPANGGKTLRMRRYNPLGTAKVPLGNSGVTPPPQTLSAVDIDATVSFYGTFVQINEQVTLQAQDRPLNEAAIRLGVSLRQTEDELTRDMLASTASFINAVGGANGDTPTNLAASDLQSVIRTLVGNDGKMISDNIDANDGIGTTPIRSAYVAMCHSDLTPDLESISGFNSKYSYPSPMESLQSEWGAFNNLRFMVSSIGSITQNASNNGDDVYNVFCAAQEAYACINQDNYSAQFIYRPPIFDGPLALNCSVGYKFAEVPRILNDLWIINCRCTLFV